LQNKHTGVL
jgi:hypothetical protein